MSPRIFILLTLLLPSTIRAARHPGGKDTVLLVSGMDSDRLSTTWLKALETRMGTRQLDSFARLHAPVTPAEAEWQALIKGHCGRWNAARDSLGRPFKKLRAPESLVILLGKFGSDDAFTFNGNTVCFDLSALQANYGSATIAENNARIDRLFGHEFTHLLHQRWATKHSLRLRSFRDSILWECFYEGLGMYRSLSAKWLPQNGRLPQVSQTALEALYPELSANLKTIYSSKTPGSEQKTRIRTHLSRGNVDQKWGAFPIALWLALEAQGDDSRLAAWIEKGPRAVAELADKYLPKNYQAFR